MTTTELLTEHSCEIVEDLLPFYTEGSIEPDAAAFVSHHLKNCKSCQSLLTLLLEDFPETEPAAAVPHSLSFHRKYRLHLAFGILCAILAALAVLALLL